MSRRAKRQAPPRTPDVSDAYHVRRDERGLLLTPRADAGPGLQARLSMLAAGVIGLAALGAGLAIGYSHSSRMVAHGTHPPVWVLWLIPGGVFFVIAGLAAAGFVQLIVTRKTTLAVSGNGALRYGRRCLVAEGEAVAVCLDRRSRRVRTTMDGVSSGPSREVKEAYVYIVTVAGRLLELPAPYFSNIDWPAAEALAKVVAEAMRVPLTTELPPGSNPHPGPGALRNRIAGSILLGFGAVAVLVGSMLVFVHLAAAVWPGGRPPAKVEWWFGLPFVVVGGGFGWIGCGFLEWGWRRWVLLLAGESVGGWLLVLAIHWLG